MPTTVTVKGRTPKTWDLIRCTSTQYNNVVMKALAMRHFYENPDCQFVWVWEHGGWDLGFRRDGSIFRSANEAGVIAGNAFPTDGPSGIEVTYPDLFSLDLNIYDADGQFIGKVWKMGGAASVIQEPGVVHLTEAHVIDLYEKPHHIRYDEADGKWKEVR